ncbi:hypothetical protein NE235_00985 [Actinoallomurus spadix]|uniref:hypothetical protein n=1 Tax=Actinoallomurus spadix TaxID=79912 RepID=UPI00209209EC|nr:hypothetical protein [Actinoallomurus spadix]MCO5984673.1 hypothetical protein [Actinoallomurus spadix]
MLLPLSREPSGVPPITRPGHTRPRDLLDLYGVTDVKVRETLTGLARDSRKKGWWQGYDDVL